MQATKEVLSWLQQQQQAAEPLPILACRQARSDVLQYLIQQDADLAALDRYGNNALWAACYVESAPCMQMLLDAGIAIDFQNATGATALIYAVSSGKHAVVERLLQAGANPAITTQDDFSAMDLAATRECLRLMKQAMHQHRQSLASSD